MVDYGGGLVEDKGKVTMSEESLRTPASKLS